MPVTVRGHQVPDADLTWRFSRSSGPGGQHVNTTDTRVQLSFDLDRVVDDAWDPPVTLGVRLVSVINETAQHLGQASYVRGLLERRPRG